MVERVTEKPLFPTPEEVKKSVDSIPSRRYLEFLSALKTVMEDPVKMRAAMRGKAYVIKIDGVISRFEQRDALAQLADSGWINAKIECVYSDIYASEVTLIDLTPDG